MKLSDKGSLSLNLSEMREIQKYFSREKREPNDIELETLAQTWSEHCIHKTFKGYIRFGHTVIDNMFKKTIARVTRELNKPWCISVFKDNAGIITLDKSHHVAFKVETHNHPSAIEPYGGANTGLGGVIRDILGVGLGAKPVMNTDVFCFARPDFPSSSIPKNILHPLRIMKGVVSGVRDYGNRMGIPTVNGAVCFDDGFLGNPLVFCGTVGVIPKGKAFKRAKTNDLVVVVGGRTGRDGIHGATFSSIGLKEKTEGSVVQIGNAIEEKKVLDALILARDLNLFNAVTDCGAGGLSSAVGEMGALTGAEVHLEKAPLKYKGLLPWEIWVSEAQERMVLAVPPQKFARLKEIFDFENVEATAIGVFTRSRRLRLYYSGAKIGDLSMDFLHDGCPRQTKTTNWVEPFIPESNPDEPANLGKILIRLLQDHNIASKEWIVRQYDHEVQGGSILKPLVGVNNDGPGDACVVQPVLNSSKAIVVGCGINCKFGKIDPYAMASSAIDEAMRNVVCVGGDPQRTALLDNFCWGNPDKKDQLGGLVLAAQACYDMAKVLETPFISGKDSLNNESQAGAIPPILLISSISVIPDRRKVVSMDLKNPGDFIYLIGMTRNELGGSCYFDLLKASSPRVPFVDPNMAKEEFKAIHSAIKSGLIVACHDCSEGGLGIAAAEMAFAGGAGIEIDLRKVPYSGELRDDYILFSESNSRFLVEIEPRMQKKFNQFFKKVPFSLIGKVNKSDLFVVRGFNKKVIIRENIANLKTAWKKTLNF